ATALLLPKLTLPGPLSRRQVVETDPVALVRRPASCKVSLVLLSTIIGAEGFAMATLSSGKTVTTGSEAAAGSAKNANVSRSAAAATEPGSTASATNCCSAPAAGLIQMLY